MSYEDRLIATIDRKRDRRIELPPVIVRAHEKAKAEVLTNPDYLIQEREFIGVYKERDIEEDEREADRLQHGHFRDRTEDEKRARAYSEILEGLVIAQGKKWLGGAEILKTARFDDYINKVDMIAEWVSKEGTKFLGLAVDVTFGANHIRDKLAEIKKEINDGKLGTIRYFKDVKGHFMGTRSNVPRVVLGISKEQVAELAGLWLNDEESLDDSPVQALFIEQMDIQLTAMRSYAEKRGKGDVVAVYDQALTTIRSLRAEKRKLVNPLLRRDPVAALIFTESHKQFIESEEAATFRRAA